MGESTGQWPCIGQWRGVIVGISHWRVDWNRSTTNITINYRDLVIEAEVS
jgi:hypothetical protein